MPVNETCTYGESDPNTFGGWTSKCNGPRDFRITAGHDAKSMPKGWAVFWVCSLHVQLYRDDPDVLIHSRDDVLIEEVERKLIEKKRTGEGTSLGGDLVIRSGTGTSTGSGGPSSFRRSALLLSASRSGIGSEVRVFFRRKPKEEKMARESHYDMWDLSDPAHAERFRVLVDNLLEKKAVVHNMDVSFRRGVDRAQQDLADAQLQEKYAASSRPV